MPEPPRLLAIARELRTASSADPGLARGVARDAIEPEDLVKSKPEQVLQRRFLNAIGGFAADEPVQCGLPANNAIHELLAKAAIKRAYIRSGERFFENVFDKVSAAPAAQDV